MIIRYTEEEKREQLTQLKKDAGCIHRMRLDGFRFWTMDLQLIHGGLFLHDLKFAIRDEVIDMKTYRELCATAFGDCYAGWRA